LRQSIGQGRPGAGIPLRGDGDHHGLLLEAIAKVITPDSIDQVLRHTSRHRRRRRRQRRISPAAVIWLVLIMGLRSDLDLPSMWRQLYGVVRQMLGRLAAIKPPTKSALSQARIRLGARPLRQLLLRSSRATDHGNATYTHYKTMPLLAMDGDSYTLPDTPANAKAFGRPGTSRDGKPLEAGYPQMHVNRLMTIGTRICLDAIIKPCNTNDHATAPYLLDQTPAGAMLLWDCGFYSFNLMHRAAQQCKFFLSPVPDHAVINPIRRLADGSYVARIYACPNDRRDDRAGLLLRVIEYTLDDPARVGCGERHRLITNLLDEQKHPAAELIVLYHQRWEIEIDNDEITTHQLNRAVELRSRTPAGAVQEMYGVLVAHNAIRAVMHEAARQVDIDPRTLSFIHAVRIIRETIPVMRAAATEQLPLLYRAMLAEIAAGRLPPRDGRINPRVVKVVRPSNFPAKKPEHRRWPSPNKTFAASIVMLN
jgi:hypothetical protein